MTNKTNSLPEWFADASVIWLERRNAATSALGSELGKFLIARTQTEKDAQLHHEIMREPIRGDAVIHVASLRGSSSEIIGLSRVARPWEVIKKRNQLNKNRDSYYYIALQDYIDFEYPLRVSELFDEIGDE